MSKRDVLTETRFGKRIAEEEGDALASYFVETEQWCRVFAGEIDIVYGPKGSGKSAIYSLLLKKSDELAKRGIVALAAENVAGAPAFRDLSEDNSASEEYLRGVWKLYFLSLLATAFRERQISGASATAVVDHLAAARLIAPGWSLRNILRSVRDYVRRVEVGAQIKINPATGMPEGIGGTISLREPSREQRERGFLSVDSLLQLADDALSQVNLTIWLVLDRLDVAFLDSDELEAHALRALFRAYLDMSGLHNIAIKVFLRDDIWQRITQTGFREASHITRYLRITWDDQSLLNVIIRRVLHNDCLQQYYDVVPETILASAPLQEKLFYRIFSQRIESGKTLTLNWMLTRTRDGSKQPAPRELIHLISSARAEQLRLQELGTSEPPGELLIDRAAIKGGLAEVSKERFEQTLCAEHSELKPVLLRLHGEKTQQTVQSLAKLWSQSEADALANAERLTSIGFFEKRGSKEQPVFWVPYVYRDALNMVQGQAK